MLVPREISAVPLVRRWCDAALIAWGAAKQHGGESPGLQAGEISALEQSRALAPEHQPRNFRNVARHCIQRMLIVSLSKQINLERKPWIVLVQKTASPWIRWVISNAQYRK